VKPPHGTYDKGEGEFKFIEILGQFGFDPQCVGCYEFCGKKDAKDGDDTDTRECIEMYTGPQGQIDYDPELQEITILKTINVPVGNHLEKESLLSYRGNRKGMKLSDTNRYESFKGHDTFQTLTREQLKESFEFEKSAQALEYKYNPDDYDVKSNAETASQAAYRRRLITRLLREIERAKN